MLSLTTNLRVAATLVVAAVLALTGLTATSVAAAATPATRHTVLPARAPDLAGAARPVTADPLGRRVRYFGAISVSRDWAAGWAYDYRTRHRAVRASLHNCKIRSNYPGSCRKIVWVRNGCAAVAAKWSPTTGFITRVSWGIAYTKRKAIRRAKAKLSAPKRTVAWVCTTRFH